jgi:hypothetical protein
MVRRIFKTMIAVLLFATFGGCATRQSLPELPTALEGKGLLVARLYVLGLHSMENASINIDGKSMSSSLRDGYIAVALEPGEHKLNQIRAEGQLLSRNMIEEESPMRLAKGGSAPTYIYIPGSSYTVHYTTLAVDRTFRIEPGKVTNLGLIVYLPVLNDPNIKKATVNSSREFRVFALDNNVETNAFLETNYPDLVRSLTSREITLAPAKYLDSKNLSGLRQAIAYYENRGPNVLASPTKTVVYGRAGTIVALNRESMGIKQPAVEVLDTGTLADIVGGVRNGEQFTFLTSDAKLLFWDGHKITQTPLPYRVHPVRLHSLGERGLIVVDNHLRILTAQNPNDEWINYEGVMTKMPRNDVNIATEKSGAYISIGNRGVPENIYFIPAGESVPKSIGTPEKRLAVSSIDMPFLVARESGLFILYNKPSFYFRSNRSQSWELYSQPQGKCKPMKIDSEGRNLAIECDGINYQSNNSGATWTRDKI